MPIPANNGATDPNSHLDNDGPGQAVPTGWVAPSDDWLAMNRNHDGHITRVVTQVSVDVPMTTSQVALAVDTGAAKISEDVDPRWSSGVRLPAPAPVPTLQFPAAIVSNANDAGPVLQVAAAARAVAPRAEQLTISALATTSPVESHVTSMVDAMASFLRKDDTHTASAATPMTMDEPHTQSHAPVLALDAGVKGMVDAMRQFNANGQANTAMGSVPTMLDDVAAKPKLQSVTLAAVSKSP